MSNARALTDHIFFETSGLSADQTIHQTQNTLHGADGGELFMQHTRAHTLAWVDGKLRTNEPTLTEGYSMRYILDEASGFAFDNDFSAKGIKTVAKSAREIGRYKQATGGMILTAPQRSSVLYTEDNPNNIVTEAERINLLEEYDQKIRAMDSSVTQVSLSIATEFDLVTIIRQDGQRLDDVRPITTVRVGVTGENKGRKEKASAGYSARGSLKDFFSTVGMDKLAERAVQQLRTNLESVECPAGEMDVILGNGPAGILLHEAIGHGLEGDANRIGASAFAGRIGEQVAARGVTVIDQGDIAGQRGALNFDDEGVETGRTVLIEDGILKGYIQDTINARLMKTAPTGNGRREHYSYMPMPRMTTTFMLAGQATKEEIFASVKGRALYAVQFGGGQVQPTTGKFVFDVQEGYLVENGKIGQSVKGVTMAGDCIGAMKAIKMLGNDLVIDNGTWTCGKQGQSVPVGVGQPHLKMGGMTIGGNS